MNPFLTSGSLACETHQDTETLERTTARFIRERLVRHEPPIYQVDLNDARRGFVASQLEDEIMPHADIEDRTVPGGPRGDISVRIVRPQGMTKILPAVMYFHGGGWVIGDHNTHDRLIREIANAIDAAVVFVDYSRSPEVQYPIALEEAFLATLWVIEKGPTLKLDPKRVAVAGDSSGGNLATAVTLLAKARRAPHILFQVLLFPTLDANFETSSYRDFATGYFVTRDEMIWFWDQYAPDLAVRTLPTVAPLRATAAQLVGLPPALIITSEYDVLRDDGEAYAHKLMQADVPVTATRYLGTIHSFMVLNALSQTPATRAAISQVAHMLYQMFNQEPERSI